MIISSDSKKHWLHSFKEECSVLVPELFAVPDFLIKFREYHKTLYSILCSVFKEKNRCITILCSTYALTHVGKLMVSWPFPGLVPFLRERLTGCDHTGSDSWVGLLGCFNLISQFYSQRRDEECREDSLRHWRVFLCPVFEEKKQCKGGGDVSIGISASQVSSVPSRT